MSDLKIITESVASNLPNPPQPGNPPEYFGEQSNDLQLNNVNDLALLSGVDKLIQDMNKILLTEVGDNIFFEIYGTDLQSLIGNKVDIDNLKAHLKDQIETALAVLILVNTDNPNDDEVPSIFQSLSVVQLDPSRFQISMSVITKSGKLATTDTITFS